MAGWRRGCRADEDAGWQGVRDVSVRGARPGAGGHGGIAGWMGKSLKTIDGVKPIACACCAFGLFPRCCPRACIRLQGMSDLMRENEDGVSVMQWLRSAYEQVGAGGWEGCVGWEAGRVGRAGGGAAGSEPEAGRSHSRQSAEPWSEFQQSAMHQLTPMRVYECVHAERLSFCVGVAPHHPQDWKNLLERLKPKLGGLDPRWVWRLPCALLPHGICHMAFATAGVRRPCLHLHVQVRGLPEVARLGCLQRRPPLFTSGCLVRHPAALFAGM